MSGDMLDFEGTVIDVHRGGVFAVDVQHGGVTRRVLASKQPRTEDGRKLAAKPVGDDGNEQADPPKPRGNAKPYLTARIARDAPEGP